MVVKADQISAEFLTIPGEKIYPVHSCFEHGFNLFAEGRLCFTGNKHDEQLPYGILILKEDIRKIKEHVYPGETVFYLDRLENRLVSGRLVIDFGNAAVFSSRFSGRFRTSPLTEIDEVFGFARGEMTGFGDTIEDIVSGKGRDTASLADCFQSRNGREISRILKKWVGYGPGLTPSGDDFLVGILFADQMLSFLGDTFKAELVKLADTDHTTIVSVNQYFCALQALFGGSFLKFADAWKSGSKGSMIVQIRRLFQYGHTSGRDMAAGLWLGIRFAVDTGAGMYKYTLDRNYK